MQEGPLCAFRGNWHGASCSSAFDPRGSLFAMLISSSSMSPEMGNVRRSIMKLWMMKP